jgi:hypothetical protein
MEQAEVREYSRVSVNGDTVNSASHGIREEGQRDASYV